MRKKTSIWHNLNLILLLIVVLPPVGLYLLWRSPQTRLTKVGLSLAFVLCVTGAAAAAVHLELHERLIKKDVPGWSYDVSVDSRGHYRVKEILPLEREIFNEIVDEMRNIQVYYGSPTQPRRVSRDALSPDSQVFENVAMRRGISTGDVRAIYVKVSSQMVPPR